MNQFEVRLKTEGDADLTGVHLLLVLLKSWRCSDIYEVEVWLCATPLFEVCLKVDTLTRDKCRCRCRCRNCYNLQSNSNKSITRSKSTITRIQGLFFVLFAFGSCLDYSYEHECVNKSHSYLTKSTLFTCTHVCTCVYIHEDECRHTKTMLIIKQNVILINKNYVLFFFLVLKWSHCSLRTSGEQFQST